MGSLGFPQDLVGYGLSEELLTELFEQLQNDVKPLNWCLKGIPNIDFYKALHPFLKKWHVTSNVSKAVIGKFYLSIDKNLHESTDCTDNAYRLIENVVRSKHSPNTPIKYRNKAKVEVNDEKLEEMGIAIKEL